MYSIVKAAVGAKNDEDPDFVIGARCDAIATDGFGETIKRAKMYRDANADFLFIEALENIEQMKKAVELTQAPLLVNLIEGGKTPSINVKQAEEIGFKIVAFPLTTLWAATNEVSDVLRIVKETGSAQQYFYKLITWVEFNEIIGLPQIRKMEEKYK